MSKLVNSVFLVLLMAMSAAATAADFSPFYLGLSNANGSQVIIFDSNAIIPATLSAVLPSGETCQLSFAEKRMNRPGDSGRQTAHNFDNMGGSVFQAGKGCLTGDKTTVLMAPEYLGKHKPILVKPGALSPLDRNDISRIEAAKQLKIKFTWRLAALSPDAMIALVQFLPQGNNNLASLVLITKDRIVFEDYKGSTTDTDSIWRVDDGGIFNPRDFEILAAFRSPHGYELVRAWAGPEGESTVLLREEGAIFSNVLTQYRYWVGL